jgi:DNA-binding CsgD family transcriptional regulator/tetratricopeptide (TPR) repeat protein
VPSQLVPLVGREAEVTALGVALDAAAAGTAGVVALAGDPGVGKSRLVDECLALARARGFLTLHAAASLLHADLHYGIVVEAIRPVVRTAEAGARTRLVEGLSDLGRLFDGLDLPAPAPLGDPGMERTRLFEAVCRLLDRLTRQQPVLLAVDDLQWADPASLAVLDYAVRGLVDRRLMVLVTRRTGEASGELDVLLSSLRRAGLLTELEIGYLDNAGVTALTRGLLADDPPSMLVGLLVDRTRGLPLFVRALVRMLVGSGRLFRSGGRWVIGQEAVDDIPPEVAELLRSRIDALPSADRAVFDTVAVAGGTIGHDLLSALGPAEGELLGCVKRLRDAGLLVELLGDAGVRYEVTHPLLAEVAYDELPAVARRRRHATVVAALRQLGSSDLGRLAYHVRGADDQIDANTALDTLVAALDKALDDKAGEDAARHAEAAIGLARRLGRSELQPRLREQRAEALELAGRADAAIEAWREAADDSTARGQAVDAARQLRRLALVEWDAGHFADSQAHLDAATAALSGTTVGPEHLALAEARMRVFARSGQVRELREEIDALDRLAVTTGSRQALVFTHLGRADLCLRSGDHAGADHAVSLVMQVAREDGLILLLEEAHRPAFCNALAQGDHELARKLAEEGHQLAQEAGVPARQIITGVCMAFADVIAGQWDSAAASAGDLVALSHRLGLRRGVAGALSVRALVHARRGEFAEATACLRDARSVYREGLANDQHVLSLGDVCEAMVLLGRSDAASAVRVAQAISTGGIAVRPFRMRVLGEAQVACGDLAGARETAKLVAADGPGAPYPAAVSDWLNGLVSQAMDEPDAAAEAFGRAADGFAALTMPYEAAVARLDWADVIASASGSAEVRGVAAAAVSGHLDELDRMGARPLANRARRLLRRLGARPTPVPRVRVAGQLSVRETEIARLVAEGLSNPDIADRLFISQRTVTTHLQHIYRRLGVASRTGLTRWVIENQPAEHRIT